MLVLHDHATYNTYDVQTLSHEYLSSIGFTNKPNL